MAYKLVIMTVLQCEFGWTTMFKTCKSHVLNAGHVISVGLHMSDIQWSLCILKTLKRLVKAVFRDTTVQGLGF